MTTELEPGREPLDDGAILAFARTVAIGALAGFVAGVMAGGAGSRIAMRITAIAAGDRFQGRITDFDAQVGDITAGGSIFLIILGGSVGILGGLIYLALRRWLADAGRWKGLAFGVLLLAVFGSAVISADNPDFHRFGPPALNIGMFTSIFILFGLLVAPLFERIEHVLPPPSLQRSGLGPRAAQLLGLLLLPAVLGFPLVARGASVILLPYVLLVVPVASSLIAGSAGRFERLSDLREHRRAMAAALVVMAVPVIAGLVLNGLAIVEIFEAG